MADHFRSHGEWLETQPSMRAVADRLGVTMHKARALRYVLTRNGVDWRAMIAEAGSPEASAEPVAPDPEISGVRVRKAEAYRYDADADEYETFVPSLKAWVHTSGEAHREILRRYSNWDGAPESVLEICRATGMGRSTVTQYLRAHGITHSAAPVSVEQVLSDDIDELAQDVAAQRFAALDARVQRRAQADLERDAERWRRFHASVLDHLEGRIEPVRLPRPSASVHGSDVWIGACDWHVGKRPHGREGSLDEQEETLAATCAAAIDTARGLRPVSRWSVYLGGDLLHADTYGLQTTRGTLQGAQAVGDLYAHVDVAIRVVCGLVDEAARSAPVRVVWVPGNHDRVSSYAVAVALAQRYRHSEAVEVDARRGPHKYVRSGTVPVLLSHGDGIKRKDYASHLAAECSPDGELAGCDIRRGLALEGHYHHEKTSRDSVSGVDVLTLASPAEEDDWHVHRGYTLSRRAMTLVFVGPRGLEGTWRVEPTWSRRAA